MVRQEGEWWSQEFSLPTPERVSRAKETFDSLATPIQEMARTNPEVADELVNLYRRLLMEVWSRVRRSGETGAIGKLSKERTEQMVRHLASAQIDFTNLG